MTIHQFEKVTLCPPTDDVPVAGRIANGGMTHTERADSADVERLIAAGWRTLRRWQVRWDDAIAGRAGYSSTELPV